PAMEAQRWGRLPEPYLQRGGLCLSERLVLALDERIGAVGVDRRGAHGSGTAVSAGRGRLAVSPASPRPFGCLPTSRVRPTGLSPSSSPIIRASRRASRSCISSGLLV